ncbi:MAG: hypothetical protein RLZZ385_2143 [Pseudomonadota bacterium]|jgi:hypothetical protein
MIRKIQHRFGTAFITATIMGVLCTPLAVMAQAPSPGTVVAFRFPELANYFNAFEVVNGAVLQEVMLTDQSPQSVIGKDLLRDSLVELRAAEGSHYHTAGDHLAMLGPYRVFESRATGGLVAQLRREHNAEEANQALAVSGAIPPGAVAVLQRGRDFMLELMDIYLNGAVVDKKTAVDDLVADYLSVDDLSVPTQPKSSDLLSKHEHSYAFRVGFPQLSGLTWASQWLQLASLEVFIHGAGNDLTVDEGIAVVEDLYLEKITRLHNSLVSLPSDIPTAPVIAPNLFSTHPEAAIILDNLSALRIVIGDILAHPDAMNKQALITSLVQDYTNKTEDLDKMEDYLLFVLRGGIFNQGGPALGGMVANERNRSRSSLEAGHVTNLPMPY